MEPFIVTGQQKNGTKILKDYLNDHNYIECFDELLMQKHDFSDPHEHLQQREDPDYEFYHEKFGFDDYENLTNYLDSFYSDASFHEQNRVSFSRGFVVHYNLLSEKLVNYMEVNDIRLIHINPDLTKLALRERYYEHEGESFEADISLTEQAAEGVKELVREGRELISDDIKQVEIDFEDLKPTKKTNSLTKPVRDDIRDLLNVRNNVVKLDEKPDKPFDIKDKVENYKSIKRHADI